MVDKITKKRTYFDIIADMLSIAGKGNGMKKTHLMYHTNLSYNQLRCYIDFLVKMDLLEVIKQSKDNIYRLTNKGKKFLEEYKKLKGLLTKAST